MPHRTTYFFPRQFPDSGFGTSSKFRLDHEKKIEKECFNGNSDPKPSKISKDVTVGGKSPSVLDRFTGDKIHGKQLAAFVNWLAEKKGERSGHLKVLLDGGDDDQDLLLRPEPPAELVVSGKERGFDRQVSLQGLSSGSSYGKPASVSEVVTAGKDRNVDRQVLLQRLSSESSYAGSLFSGTTLDGNLSSGVKDSQVSITREDGEEESKDTLAKRTRESYYLQITFARRLTEQASLASEPILLQEFGPASFFVSSDAETVSYRLWVHFLCLTCAHTYVHEDGIRSCCSVWGRGFVFTY